MKEYRPINRLKTRYFLIAWLLLGLAADARAQAAGPRFPTVLWADCGGAATGASTDDGPITLHEIAVRARPALWFSRDEPLLDLTGPLPREWPRREGREAAADHLVYYRITKIKSSSTGDALTRALQNSVPAGARASVTRDGANPEAIAQLPLERALLQQISELVIRYMFYYPNELGAHSHVHDLESVELRVVVEHADERGDPRVPDGPCLQIRVATFYGAAHGLGLYTNVLDLDEVLRDRLDETAEVFAATSRRTRVTGAAPLPIANDRLMRTDPFWPLLVLVEEGKHASAPDRNGDGMFTPNYDVNRFSADAWGVRDTMRSSQLAPAFKSDTFKQRIPAIATDETGTLQPAQQDSFSLQAFGRYLRYTYFLRRPTEDQEICGDPARDERARRVSLEQYAADIKPSFPTGDAKELLEGKAFCDDTTLQSLVTSVDVMRHIGFGGAYNGFTHWWERISGSARFDGGFGWAATIPVGMELPGLGGWVVGRLVGPWVGTTSRKSADVAYMPSASRLADWYVAGGLDYGRYVADDRVESGNRFALETGVKFRFPLPKYGTFFGGRIGIRSNGHGLLERQRLVFEAGAGIW